MPRVTRNETDSSQGKDESDGPTIQQKLHRPTGEEFPRVETEIVRGVSPSREPPDTTRKNGRFSLFHWFRKYGQDAETVERRRGQLFNNNTDIGSLPAELSRLYSSSGSVDTTCSTATSHSFTFQPGDVDRTSNNGEPTKKSRGPHRFFSIDAGAYDNVRFDAEALSEDERGASSTRNDGAPISEERRRENERFLSPCSTYNYRSLPSLGKTADVSKYKRVHVRGKRRAPKPPVSASLREANDLGASERPDLVTPELTASTERSSGCKSPTGHSGRRKRRAPQPPGNDIVKPIKPKVETCATTSPRNDVNSIETRIKEDAKEAEAGMSSGRKRLGEIDNDLRVISNDTLKLEGGVLLPTKTTATKMHAKVLENKLSTDDGRSSVMEALDAARTLKTPSFQVSHSQQVAPRPWYKRSSTTLTDRDLGSFKREVLKIPTLSKLKENRNSRFIHHEVIKSHQSNEASLHDRSFGKLNFFARPEKREDLKKKEEKRKSGLSILTNISELDREAAAIVQAEQARSQAMLSRSSLFTDAEKPSSGEIISEIVASQMEPQRRGTRALISKFNAISNITKVTVNATFFHKGSAAREEQPLSKVDALRCDVISNDRDRIVTKRLLYDGEEQVGEISSINFFRQLEAQALNSGSSGVTSAPNDRRENKPAKDRRATRAPPTSGWEEKIKRYFPEIESRSQSQAAKSNVVTEKLTPPHKEVSAKPMDSVKNPSDPTPKKTELSDRDRKLLDFSSKNDSRDKKAPTETLSRAELKEMLKEMKHSLPKRPKPKSGQRIVAANGNDAQQPNRGRSSSRSFDSPVIIHRNEPALVQKLRASDRCSKMEVKSSSKSLKVSSAAQTSANVRKIDLPEKDSSQSVATGWALEDTIYTTNTRRKGGGLARNTFQLIRPRDFACIEALKTEKNASKETQNTYMNVIEDSLYANTVICSSTPRDAKSDSKMDSRPNIVPVGMDEAQQPSVSSEVKNETTKREKTPKKIEGEEEKPRDTNMNTVAINRLLRKLEGAIASGQHQQAAGLARELAQLKIHCSVVRQRFDGNEKLQDIINVDMYIEDKLAHQGPIPLRLPMNTSVAELKTKVFTEFEIPTNVQRWIIGKNLADKDELTLAELKAVDRSSIFLYLVAPDLQNNNTKQVDDEIVVKEEPAVVEEQPISTPIQEDPVEESKIIPQEPSTEELKLKQYEHLMSLENTDVIPNSVPIECPICFAPYGPLEGVILRDCLHMFCRACIANTIMYCEEAEVKCPFRDLEYTCESTLQEREIKALVTPEVYEQHLTKSMMQAENNAGNNAFHCKTPDCPGWCIYDDNVNVFLCPVCGINNCLTCQAIHTNKNCREYQDEIKLTKETDQETKRTAAVLEEMVESGEALACPTCAVVLMKKWGCDWLRCSMCKTEICWVTRGPRWGPGGKGDTSGGCKCGENGVKCHPRCNYCH